MPKPTLNIDTDEIAVFCRRHDIARLSLFGSARTDTFTKDSDVDLLVEFLPGIKISLLDMAGMETQLTDIIGRKVDLRTAAELSQYFRDDVIQSSESLYAGASG